MDNTYFYHVNWWCFFKDNTAAQGIKSDAGHLKLLCNFFSNSSYRPLTLTGGQTTTLLWFCKKLILNNISTLESSSDTIATAWQ